MVGSSQLITCTVSTVNGVESSLVMISWMGPKGDAIMNNTRMTINPATSNGNSYTSSLQITYLLQNDEGNYTCFVAILEAIGSQSVELEQLMRKFMNNTVIKVAFASSESVQVSILVLYLAPISFLNLKFLLFCLKGS